MTVTESATEEMPVTVSVTTSENVRTSASFGAANVGEAAVGSDNVTVPPAVCDHA